MKMKWKKSRGFTLAEGMIAMVVLSIATAGVILPFAGGSAVQAEGSRRTLAAKLAADLLEEVAATNFDDIISTYNYSEAEGLIKRADAVVFSDSVYAGFSRTVVCQDVELADLPNVDIILATVTVFYRGGEVVTLDTLIGR